MLKSLRNPPPKLLEAIKEFRKSAEYKVNIKKIYFISVYQQ